MSWLDRISKKFYITTGDNKLYSPSWMNAVKTKEWNVAEFEFINVPGTLVKRGTPKGRKFNLEIYFQGDDHLDTSEDFEKSCDDPRPWKIDHPYYGPILVQPISLSFDNTAHNVTKITGTLTETIDESNPRITVNATDKIGELHFTMNSVFEERFALEPRMTRVDITHLTSNLDDQYKKTKKKITLTDDLNAYFNAFNEANAAINNFVEEPLLAIRTTQAVINAPILFTENAIARVGMLITQFDSLLNTIRNVSSVGQKIIFENNAGINLGAMALASVTDPDYANRAQVVGIIDLIVSRFNTYVSTLDSIQSLNGGNPDSYMPDQNSMQSLSNLINYTISNLFNIAANSKQERIIYLDSDTNLILLTHRYYGLDPNDDNITKMLVDNDIGLNELLQIKKNRKIAYYIG